MHDLSRTALYRMFSREGDLLYVGITKSLAARLGQHDAGKDWFHLVDSIKLAHYPTRDQARRAEIMAIQKESPAFNIADRAEGDPPRFVEYGIDLPSRPAAVCVGRLPRGARFGQMVPAFAPGVLSAALVPDPGVPFHAQTFAQKVNDIATTAGIK